MSFGWSAGDIVSAITFLYKVVDALSRLPEASKTYHQTFRFLEITEINLKHLKKILEDHESGIATIQDDGRVQHLRVICSNFKLSVDELGKKLAEHCGLDKKAKGLHWPEQQLGKLKWKFFDEDSIKKLMDDVNNQSTQLQIFLQIQNTYESLSFQKPLVDHLRLWIKKI
ncbi:MAG: hypothetical protein OHK93_003378 [Ramalina farinacea]|uniref:Uncharacterized protein n=1 Tax=Ramalina farinacea TaxID=258253 RepID=A0AA43TUM0_9LECA|nr:hypothetical protein [Ramalina farinacea]